ncbi:MAG: hypothetical protein C4563_07735 [Desulfobulbus sp.]|nr:MAG: hypothetical protein C4563_07735 [Desulfobulbus sp.]
MGHPRKKRAVAKGRKRKSVSNGIAPLVVPRGMPDTRRSAEWNGAGAELSGGRLPTLEELESEYIRKVLRHVSDNKTRAARILGINRVSLWRKIKSMELSAPVF